LCYRHKIKQQEGKAKITITNLTAALLFSEKLTLFVDSQISGSLSTTASLQNSSFSTWKIFNLDFFILWKKYFWGKKRFYFYLEL
jgi:hypothetical protein